MIIFINAVVRTLGSVITGGTNIGDATAGGGLAAAFDGDTDQINSLSAQKASTGNFYIGKTISKRVYQAITYGCNGQEYWTDDPSMTIYLYGKTGSAPASGTDGTQLGSVSFTDGTAGQSNPRTISSSDKETVWDHIWIYAVRDSGTANARCAEVELYEAV